MRKLSNVRHGRSLYYNKYNDAEECAAISLECKHPEREKEFFLNLYTGIGYRDGDRRDVPTATSYFYGCDADLYYAKEEKDDAFLAALQTSLQEFMEIKTEEDYEYTYNLVGDFEEIEFLVVPEFKISKEAPNIDTIQHLRALLSEAEAPYKKDPLLLR